MKKYVITIVNKAGHRIIEADSYEVDPPFIHLTVTEAGIKRRVASFNNGMVEGIVEKK